MYAAYAQIRSPSPFNLSPQTGLLAGLYAAVCTVALVGCGGAPEAQSDNGSTPGSAPNATLITPQPLWITKTLDTRAADNPSDSTPGQTERSFEAITGYAVDHDWGLPDEDPDFFGSYGVLPSNTGTYVIDTHTLNAPINGTFTYVGDDLHITAALPNGQQAQHSISGIGPRVVPLGLRDRS